MQLRADWGGVDELCGAPSAAGDVMQDFVKKIKFGKACELIESGKYNISDISTMVGFSSSSYFSSAFKKYVGCLPSEYLDFKNSKQLKA